MKNEKNKENKTEKEKNNQYGMENKIQVKK